MLKKEYDSDDSSSDEGEVPFGYHRLKRAKKEKISNYLSNITSSSDILFNSQNIKIKSGWIYKELIKDNLPKLFNFIFNDPVVQPTKEFIEEINKIVQIWIKWEAFEPEYYSGLLLYVDTKASPEFKNEFLFKVKPKLDSYESGLVELYTNNEKELRKIAKRKGIYEMLSYGELMEKLLKVQEMLLYKECAKECDGEECDEEMIDLKINQLRKVLDVMKKGFSSLNAMEIDGVKLDKLEYEFFGIDEEKESIDNKIDIENYNNMIDDIDGEPI